MMLEQSSFFQRFNINPDKFEETGLDWENLMEIYKDYQLFKQKLDLPAIYVFNTLMTTKNVHSVRYRIKDPEHLIEKIIRKKIEDKNSNITIDNYKQTVNDLIGIRALHLFKDDWSFVDDFIRNNWTLKEKPVANYRKGDSPAIIDYFKKKECDTKEHKYGYRSIHYTIETKPGKELYFAEIQVRTIFEEAWSEIDHTIRYPYEMGNQLFSQFLLILNRLAGSADEMGSYIQFLKNELSTKEKLFSKQMDEKDILISNLEAKVARLNPGDHLVKSIITDVKKLKNTDQKWKKVEINENELLASLDNEIITSLVHHSQFNLYRTNRGNTIIGKFKKTKNKP